jgi:hypothetical protein
VHEYQEEVTPQKINHLQFYSLFVLWCFFSFAWCVEMVDLLPVWCVCHCEVELFIKITSTRIWSLEISWSRMKQMEKEGENTGIPCTLFSVTKLYDIYFHYCDYYQRIFFKWLITKSHLTCLLLILQHHKFVCLDNNTWLEYKRRSFLLRSV